MNSRQIMTLIAGTLFIVGSLLPKPVIERATGRPFEHQTLARLCVAALGIVMILFLRTVQ